MSFRPLIIIGHYEKFVTFERLVLLCLRNKPKYVNMADINPPVSTGRAKAGGSAVAEKQRSDGEPSADELFHFVEALFFAYRDFTGDPDLILNEIGFGRAHHRVLHFVDRYPGMRVADLLEILKITKQSLARVLRELIKNGYIVQSPGKADKRERLLYTTETGSILARRLAEPQLGKIRRALARLDEKGAVSVARFLADMQTDADRRPSAKRHNGSHDAADNL